ncbi:MAG: UDP-3-O-(3-hydroxymyristoyl)glucosamine N-acyltransferase [Bacteroidota bacterium]
MKFQQPQTLSNIAAVIGCPYIGSPDFPVLGINEIHRVEPGDICFVDHPKYYDKALNSAATIIIINKEVDCPEGKALIISETPFLHFNFLTQHFKPYQPFPATVHPDTQVGEGTDIMPNVTIDKGVTIGKNCRIYPGVVIYGEAHIGDNVILHANVVIGSDAFYYNRKQGIHNKMHSCGRVIIHDDVEIGAGSTIDKGVSADTIIGAGTKIDNQVQIAHDTTLGTNCLVAAQSGIAGCTTIGNNVIIWGQVAIISGITIGDGAEILAKSGVGKSLEGGKRYFGAPAEEARQKMKEAAKLKRLLGE